tara:strand:- start:3960 stop:4418 length:459 start_codon:yes stop_codon:yes gene_type:complete
MVKKTILKAGAPEDNDDVLLNTMEIPPLKHSEEPGEVPHREGHKESLSVKTGKVVVQHGEQLNKQGKLLIKTLGELDKFQKDTISSLQQKNEILGILSELGKSLVKRVDDLEDKVDNLEKQLVDLKNKNNQKTRRRGWPFSRKEGGKKTKKN